VQSSRRLLTDDVFDRVRDDIVRGRLAPGERIHDAELASRLGVSRATVRTALLRLTDIGLVEAVPNLYTRVTLIDLRRYLETQDTAHALYTFAARFGTPLLRDEHIEAMQRWSARLGHRKQADLEGIYSGEVVAGFFAAFVDVLDNTPLRRTIARLWPGAQRVLARYADLLPIPEIDEVFIAVVNAASRRDEAGAATALAAFYDGPLALFHQRLSALPEFARD
jgi:DNA-binding GntR family transcriptional regulator